MSAQAVFDDLFMNSCKCHCQKCQCHIANVNIPFQMWAKQYSNKTKVNNAKL